MHLHRVGWCAGKAHTEKVSFWLHLLDKQKVEEKIINKNSLNQGKRTKILNENFRLAPASASYNPDYSLCSE
jgi:hypothetical protein